VAADRTAFRTTRSLEGSPRWAMAARDANHSPKSLMKAFSCAAGIELSPERAPHLAELLATAGADAARVASHAKRNYVRSRPYALYEGATCLPSKNLNERGDYPSGHSARGWGWALVLVELIPNRREQLTSRARAYADSRVVCGFHSPMGADAGHAVAALTVSSLKRNPSFRADLQQASREVTTVRQLGQAPPPGQCRFERLMMHRPY
jgi:acid phosphatase (class A)